MNSTSTHTDWFERLDPDARELMQVMRGAPRRSFEEMTIEEVRAMMPAATGPALPREHDEVIALPGRDITVRFYHPNAEPNLSVLVFLHGGGWVMGHLDGYDGMCRDIAVSAGCIVASVDYRLAPEHPYPAAVEDSYAAWQWVVANAERFDGDAARVAIGGDSAGANLATVVTIMARELGGPRAACQVLLYPGIDPQSTRPAMVDSDNSVISVAASEFMWGTYVGDTAHFRSPYVAPMQGNLAGLPPAVVVTAEVDVNRDDGAAYVDALSAAGVDAELLHYPGTYHGFLMHTAQVARARQGMDDVAARLRTAFGL